MSELDEMRVFVRVVELGSFAAAAGSIPEFRKSLNCDIYSNSGKRYPVFKKKV